MKLFYIFVPFWIVMATFGCNDNPKSENGIAKSYFKQSPDSVQVGGVKVITINTNKGNFKVWTKRIGNNPKIKLLLLSGGPGLSHEYFECMESFLPAEGIEFIYYDQLGTGFSDNPNDVGLWDLARSVEELEQVRKALNLNESNFYLLGHSWGGILGIEYALKYQNNLKGLIISNMMASAPEYGKYSEVLAKQMNPKVLTEIRKLEVAKDYTNPKYMDLLINNYYSEHVCRIPVAIWPEPINRSFSKINYDFYLTMQGPSELGISGKLTNWDRKKELSQIAVPTLTIGAKYDTMDPEHMKWMASQVKNGSYLYCPSGSHMSFYDNQKVYMNGLIAFLKSTSNKN